MRASATPGRILLPGVAGEDRPAVPEAEAHYLTRVCRARAGDVFEATDGAGTVARLRLEGLAPVEVSIEARSFVARGPGSRLLCGAPEGDRADWLIEKLAELGVERWQPVDTERSRWTSAQLRTDRWQRVAAAALRQSLGAYLLAVDPVLPLTEAVSRLPDKGRRWLAMQEGKAPGVLPVPPLEPEAAVIGPAPGLSLEEEASLIAAGFEPVRLAATRLRTETAALAWASWWAARSGAKES